MAVMTDPDRQLCFADYMRNQTAAVGALVKSELRAAVDAADQWCSDNQASYLAALPSAFTTPSTADQDAKVLVDVLYLRAARVPPRWLLDFGSIPVDTVWAAAVAAEAWCTSNATSYNTALPQPARGVLTSAQKALLLAWVVLWRRAKGVS